MPKKVWSNRKKKGHFHQGPFQPKNPQKYRGTLPIIYRSNWEKVFMNYCDVSNEVQYWGSETVIIKYFDPVKRKMRRYFTDFSIIDNDGNTTIIEIKPSYQTKAPVAKKGKKKTTLLRENDTWVTNQAKWEATERVCKKNGWTFKILTGKSLGLRE